jgi:excisionase family DNA binding protein
MGEIARHLGVSQDTVHRWIRGREMPARQIGRLWKFKVLEVDEWVRRGGQNEPPRAFRDSKENQPGES